MSTLGDAMAAIRSVIMMQGNLEHVERQVEKLGDDQAGLREAMARIDNRLVRVETIIEEARAARRLPDPPRIEE